jgi:hypothetical protein
MVHAAVGWVVTRTLIVALKFPLIEVLDGQSVATPPVVGLLVLASYIGLTLVLSQVAVTSRDKSALEMKAKLLRYGGVSLMASTYTDRATAASSGTSLQRVAESMPQMRPKPSRARSGWSLTSTRGRRPVGLQMWKRFLHSVLRTPNQGVIVQASYTGAGFARIAHYWKLGTAATEWQLREPAGWMSRVISSFSVGDDRSHLRGGRG